MEREQERIDIKKEEAEEKHRREEKVLGRKVMERSIQ